MTKLHLGCGSIIMPGWVNVDLRCKAANIMECCIALPSFEENSIDEIYSSHMIEHLTHDQNISSLSRWFDLLVPGGRLRLRCPNGKWFCRTFLNASAQSLYSPYGGGKAGIFGGLHNLPFSYHRNMFSSDSLKHYVEQAGFRVNKCYECAGRMIVQLREFLLSGGEDKGILVPGQTSDLWLEAFKP